MFRRFVSSLLNYQHPPTPTSSSLKVLFHLPNNCISKWLRPTSPPPPKVHSDLEKSYFRASIVGSVATILAFVLSLVYYIAHAYARRGNRNRTEGESPSPCPNTNDSAGPDANCHPERPAPNPPPTLAGMRELADAVTEAINTQGIGIRGALYRIALALEESNRIHR